MNKFIIPLIISLITTCAIGQEKYWTTTNIADSLLQNANAVYRLNHTTVNILSQDKMKTTKDVVVTVLNKEGNEDGYVYLPYDKDTHINHFSAVIYNAAGKVIDKIKAKDLQDESSSDGISIYNDDRIKYYQHNPLKYPYTIHYKYEVTTSNTAFIRKWVPINYYYASTEKSTFKMTYPSDIKIRTKTLNFKHHHIKKSEKPNEIYYELVGGKAFEYEAYSPSFLEFGPHVKFAANKFHIAGVDGQANNWLEFGQWMQDELLTGRDQLPQETITEVKNLVHGISDPVEKAKLVYDYMQKKTRYISIQIGIGGWKPMLASEVESLRYGDCKALTNYTQALLKAVDVPSNYTIIYAKERRNIDNDLASLQGNHAILMIPTKKDTVWLECTSQKVPFGYLGTFTDDRDALVVTKDGGKIIRTKKYAPEDNLQLINGTVNLLADGSIDADLKIKSSGIQYNDNYSIAYLDSKKKDRYYKKFFREIHNVKINHISMENDENNIEFKEHITFNAQSYASKAGNRLIFRLNALNTNDNIPEKDRNRQQPLEISYGFVDQDDVIITLPEEYDIEALAKNQELSSPFGTYKMTIEKLEGHQIKYTRYLKINQGVFPKEAYDKYRKFRKKINQLDQSKIVLIHKIA